MFIVLLLGGVACILFPNVILDASGMSALEDDRAFAWLLRAFGVVLLGIAIWAIHAAVHR